MYVLCDLDYDRLGAKEGSKNRAMEAKDEMEKKYGKEHIRDDNYRLKGLDTCKVLVCSVFTSVMDHINDLKEKGLRVLLCYHFGSEKLKGVPKKV